MNPKEQALAELREITLWHQLNRRLIESGGEGQAIVPEQHHFLQLFCFENQLFRNIAEANNLFEIPLVLITDLDDITFVTLKMDGWNHCLMEFLRIFKPGSRFLLFNLDEALAESYDVLSDLDRRYNLVETTPDDVTADADETLFEFINQYLKKKGNVVYDFESLVLLFHKIRGQFLQLIISRTSARIPVERLQNRLLIIIRDKKQKSVFRQIYKEIFLPKLRETSTHPLDLLIHNNELISYLREKASESQYGPIEQFAGAEIKLLQEQNLFLTVFNGDIDRLVGHRRIYLPNIPIVDLPGLSFLRKPFPAITPHRQ